MDREEWESLFWNRQLEAKERMKANKCSSTNKFHSKEIIILHLLYKWAFVKKKTKQKTPYFPLQIGLNYILCMKRMNSASGLSKIFWLLWIYTEPRGIHTEHDRGNYQAARTCASILPSTGVGTWLAIKSLCIAQPQLCLCGRMVVRYWIFDQLWEFALPFFLQRLSLPSICECFICVNTRK